MDKGRSYNTNYSGLSTSISKGKPLFTLLKNIKT